MKQYHLRTLSSVAIVATVVLAATGTAYSSDILYDNTTNDTAGWRIQASGPSSIVCPGVGGACTQMSYLITGLRTATQTQDHVAVLAAHDVTVLESESVIIYPTCDGDNLTSLGIRDCSMQAVRLNKRSDVATYDLIVQGDAIAIDSSIVIKKGKSLIEEGRIASLGLPPPPICDPKAQQTSKETFTFNDCEIEVAIDPCTGESGEATVLSGDCVIDVQPVESLQLVINGVTQNVTTGDGWISSGNNSCTTKINRLTRTAYTVCDCKDASDPTPPCP